MTDNRWKLAFLIQIVVLGFVAAGIIGYFIGKAKDEDKGKTQISGPAVAVGQQNPSENPTVQPTPGTANQEVKATESAEINPDQAIINAVYKTTGYSRTDYNVNVSRKEGIYVTGGIKQAGVSGGTYFLAVNDNGVWRVIYYGDDMPTCQELEPYNFPPEIVPSCKDENGNPVSRQKQNSNN